MMKKHFIQPFLISFIALKITFLFFVFNEYHKSIFAARIFLLDTLGLFAANALYSFILPQYKSIIKRSLLIVFTYFTFYEIIDTTIYLLKYHVFLRTSRTDIAEAEAAVLTFLFTLLISFLVQFYNAPPKERE